MTGFNSKRDAAADKLQEPEREALKLALEVMQINLTLLEKVDPYEDQEDLLSDSLDVTHKAITAIKAALAQPAQEPVALVTGVFGGRFTYEPLNRAAILPVGMALYAAPPQPAQEHNFCSRCGKRTNDIHTCTPPQGDA